MLLGDDPFSSAILPGSQDRKNGSFLVKPYQPPSHLAEVSYFRNKTSDFYTQMDMMKKKETQIKNEMSNFIQKAMKKAEEPKEPTANEAKSKKARVAPKKYKEYVGVNDEEMTILLKALKRYDEKLRP